MKLGLHEKRTVLGGCGQRIWVRRARLFLTPPACWTYATKDGRAVLRGEESWRDINGFQLRAGTWQVWITLRRRAVWK